MSALLFIQDKRKQAEKIDIVGMMSIAMHGKKEALQKAMERWAKDAEIRLTFEED